MTNFAVSRLDHAEVTRRAPEFIDIYREVYAEPPYHEGDNHVAAYASRFAEESNGPGFTLVAAEASRELVGYAYGLTLAPHEWWTDADHEPAQVHGRAKFAVMEFAVRKAHRGRGIGTALMTALLADRPEPFATLCANPAAPARRIYHRWGWRPVALARPPDIPTMDVLLLHLRQPETIDHKGSLERASAR
jgi:GNAT superfamily N-acetyltransferase